MRSKSEELMNNIVNYIDDKFINENRVPTLQEIADNFEVTKGSICQYIKVMTERGMIEQSKGWHGLVTPRMKKFSRDGANVPLVGYVACGTPVLAEENIEKYVYLPKEITGPGKFYLLRASGDSMINADIQDGDLVLVREQNEANEGDIVVALINDETTLKRFYVDKKKKKIRLHPENDEMEDMFFDSIAIQGVATKVLKDIR